MAILDNFLTEGECAYGMMCLRSSKASLRSCMRRRSLALMLSLAILLTLFFLEDFLPPLVLSSALLPSSMSSWMPSNRVMRFSRSSPFFKESMSIFSVDALFNIKDPSPCCINSLPSNVVGPLKRKSLLFWSLSAGEGVEEEVWKLVGAEEEEAVSEAMEYLDTLGGGGCEGGGGGCGTLADWGLNSSGDDLITSEDEEEDVGTGCGKRATAAAMS